MSKLLEKYKEEIDHIIKFINENYDYVGGRKAGNNWAGHIFTAPNGWEFKTDTEYINHWPGGEKVSVYEDGDFLLSFGYLLIGNNVIFTILEKIINKLEPMIEEKMKSGELKRDYYRPIDIATATAEYLYALDNKEMIISHKKGNE